MSEENAYRSTSAWHAKSQALLELKNWPQLKAVANQWLSAVPTSEVAHYYAGFALMKLANSDGMATHARYLLERNPTWVFSHDLACRIWLERQRFDFGLYHAQKMIGIDPENPWGYYFASVCVFSENSIHAAQSYIESARELDPNNSSLAQFQMRVELSQADTAEKMKRLEGRYFDVLKLNPEKASSHEALGDLYLNEYVNSRRALECYRDALILDPTDDDCQRKFTRAFKRSNLFFRTLFGHQFLFMKVGDYVDFDRRLSLLTVIWIVFAILPLVYLGLALLTFLFASILVLIVPAVLTEALCFPDVMRSVHFVRWRISRLSVQRLPFWSRCAIVAIASIIYWSGLLWLSGFPLGKGIGLLAAIIGLNLWMQLAFLGYKKSRLTNESWIFGGIFFATISVLSIGWGFGFLDVFGAVGIGISVAILLFTIQLMAIFFRWKRRRGKRKVSFVQAKPAPLP